MSKTIKKKDNKSVLSTFDMSKYIPDKYQTLSAVLLILFLLAIYFGPAIWGGKVFNSGDVITQNSSKVFYDKGDNYLWNPYIFCGMPLFGNAGWYDVINKTTSELRLFYTSFLSTEHAGYTFYLLILVFGSFSFMRYKKASLGISLFVAISTMFSMGLVSLIFEGHINKLSTVSLFPIILLMIIRLHKKIKLLDVVILLVALKVMFSQWHVQIIFYVYYSLVIYFIFYFIMHLRNKEKESNLRLFKTGIILVVLTVAGFAMQYYRLGQMYEYTPYSTRGSKSINDIETKDPALMDKEYYEYSTQWSFSPGEVLTFIIPSYYGFGSSTYNGPLTQNRDTEVNTYFGQMPFTHAAMYMGIVTLALAIFAMFIGWRDNLLKYFAILIVISLVLSFGKNLTLLYDLFFYNVPFFSKFRVPAMILIIIQIVLPIVAGLGLIKIKELRGNLKYEKIITRVVGISGVLLLLILVGNSVLGEWFSNRVVDYVGTIQKARPQYAGMFNALKGYMSDMFVADFRMSAALITLTFLFILLYSKNRINYQVLAILIIVISIFDLLRIDNRALKFYPSTVSQNRFNKPDYITYLDSIKDDSPYRLINLKQDGSPGTLRNSANYNMYFLKEDLYGYSALKPRAIQDIMDIVGPANKTLWRMLNVKYIITEQPIGDADFTPVFSKNKTVVSAYNNVLPRIYLVDSVAIAKGIPILNAIKNNSFDPKQLCFVEDSLNIEFAKPDSSSSVKLLKYEELKIEAEVKASGTHMLFVGNTFYPIGWNAYIDDVKVEMVKVNHGYTGIVVSKGTHNVKLVYSPNSYEIGKYLTLILNLLTIGLVLIVVVFNRKKN